MTAQNPYGRANLEALVSRSRKRGLQKTARCLQGRNEGLNLGSARISYLMMCHRDFVHRERYESEALAALRVSCCPPRRGHE
jgi:hypothetical protein